MSALFEPRAEDLASLLPESASASILDVGCGNGFLTYYLTPLFGQSVGVDYSQAMLTANPSTKTACASALALPFGDRSFDLVVASHLLHHLEADDRRRAVQEMARVARRRLILYEPNRNNPLMFLFGLLKPEERLSLSFSARYLRGLIAESGFGRIDVRVEGMTVPNRAPAFVAPLGRALGETWFRRFGLYIRGIASRCKEAPGSKTVHTRSRRPTG